MNEEGVFQHLHKLFYDDMDLCGCGEPDEAYNLVRELLEHMPFYTPGNYAAARALIPNSGAWHIVLSAMTHANLIEHGGSISGSWLTNKGTWALWALTHFDYANDLDDAGFPHYPDPCTAACFVIPEAAQ